MSSVNSRPILHHHDLRRGWTFPTEMTIDRPEDAAVRDAIRRSEASNTFEVVQETPLLLRVQLQREADGNMFFWVASAGALGAGKVPSQQMLYSGAIACQEATSPIPWRHINGQYRLHMLASDIQSPFHAFGTMPRSYPWLCGFSDVSVHQLLKPEWEKILSVIRSTACQLAVRAQDAVLKAAAKGIVPERDEDIFLELRDWGY